MLAVSLTVKCSLTSFISDNEVEIFLDLPLLEVFWLADSVVHLHGLVVSEHLVLVAVSLRLANMLLLDELFVLLVNQLVLFIQLVQVFLRQLAEMLLSEAFVIGSPIQKVLSRVLDQNTIIFVFLNGRAALRVLGFLIWTLRAILSSLGSAGALFFISGFGAHLLRKLLFEVLGLGLLSLQQLFLALIELVELLLELSELLLFAFTVDLQDVGVGQLLVQLFLLLLIFSHVIVILLINLLGCQMLLLRCPHREPRLTLIRWDCLRL